MKYLIFAILTVGFMACNNSKKTQTLTNEQTNPTSEIDKKDETDASYENSKNIDQTPVQNTPSPNTADEAILTVVDDMANKLNLSDSQKKKFKVSSWEMVNNLDKIRSGETVVDRSERGKALVAVVNDYKNEVHHFLNDEQIILFDQLIAEKRSFLGPGMGRDWD